MINEELFSNQYSGFQIRVCNGKLSFVYWLLLNVYFVVNSEDLDEMLPKVSTLFAITKTIFGERNTIYLEIIAWDPSIYTMDHPKLIVSNKKKSLLVYKGLSLTNLSFPFFPSLALLLFSLSALGLFLKHNVFFI